MTNTNTQSSQSQATGTGTALERAGVCRAGPSRPTSESRIPNSNTQALNPQNQDIKPHTLKPNQETFQEYRQLALAREKLGPLQKKFPSWGTSSYGGFFRV